MKNIYSCIFKFAVFQCCSNDYCSLCHSKYDLKQFEDLKRATEALEPAGGTKKKTYFVSGVSFCFVCLFVFISVFIVFVIMNTDVI